MEKMQTQKATYAGDSSTPENGFERNVPRVASTGASRRGAVPAATGRRWIGGATAPMRAVLLLMLTELDDPHRGFVSWKRRASHRARQRRRQVREVGRTRADAP